MANSDPHGNAHRKTKHCFQANLVVHEVLLVNEVKRLKNVETDRELLLLLCEEANEKK